MVAVTGNIWRLCSKQSTAERPRWSHSAAQGQQLSSARHTFASINQLRSCRRVKTNISSSNLSTTMPASPIYLDGAHSSHPICGRQRPRREAKNFTSDCTTEVWPASTGKRWHGSLTTRLRSTSLCQTFTLNRCVGRFARNMSAGSWLSPILRAQQAGYGLTVDTLVATATLMEAFWQRADALMRGSLRSSTL